MEGGDRQKIAQPSPQLDLKQIVQDAQSRWLRPLEICEVLRCYPEMDLKTSPAPPYQPPTGSLFLFDRKALRYFRKDGHNWRKKKDGKTVKEAHERLKVGSVNALHCYYAHGEENMNFQRRSYWLLEGAHEHIVLVHYLEALQGNRSSVFRLHDHSLNRQLARQAANNDGNSPNSIDADGADSGDEVEEVQIVGMDPQRRPYSLLDQLSSSEPIQKRRDSQASSRPSKIQQVQSQTVHSQLSDINEFLDIADMKDGNDAIRWNDLQDSDNVNDTNLKFATWEEVFEQSREPNSCEQLLESLIEPLPESNLATKADSPSSVGDSSHNVAQQNHLTPVDSFGRWIMNKIAVDSLSETDALLSSSFDEQGDLETSFSSYEESRPTIQVSDQKFKILEFAPDSAEANAETKILVTGQFLVAPYEQSWCCMFGEVEVRAEIVGNNALCCKCPAHPSGTVPFYITCNNRTSCSEIRDFEFRSKPEKDQAAAAEKNPTPEDLLLQLKLVRLLCSIETSKQASIDAAAASKIRSAFKKHPEQWDSIAAAIRDKSRSSREIQDSIFDAFCRVKMQDWLIRRAGQEGKGACVYDKEGQGLIHIVAALGLDWAIAAVLAAGVVVNFRDLHGWTALHWAAYYGREDVILALIAAKAVPELLTDPTAAYPNGQTAADMASSRGYPGLAGYLAEASLEHHLSVLTLKDGNLNEIHYTNASLAGENAASRLFATESADDDLLKQSLSAVRRATQAAALIQSAFREFTFRKKQEEEDAWLLDITDDNVDYLMAAQKIQKAYRGHKTNKRNMAATKIQSKFRGWKGRHEYLLTRQKIIKIQAIVRGHQARNQYMKILWSVGVLEKVVLRWHRGRHGLRGFQAEDRMAVGNKEEADDEFLVEGRKQKEQVVESAVQRVQDMVHDPEARAQYARMRAISQQNQADDMVEDFLS